MLTGKARNGVTRRMGASDALRSVVRPSGQGNSRHSNDRLENIHCEEPAATLADLNLTIEGDVKDIRFSPSPSPRAL